MATSIAFTDGTGAATLTNGQTAPVDRFWAWVNWPVEVGVDAVTLADGITHHFPDRTDYLASFELRMIPASSAGTVSRLIRWLAAGVSNTITVNTGDTSSRSYTVRLAPGTVPTFELADEARRWYTLRLTVKNTTAADLLCTY